MRIFWTPSLEVQTFKWKIKYFQDAGKLQVLPRFASGMLAILQPNMYKDARALWRSVAHPVVARQSFAELPSKNYLFVNVTETSIQGLTIYETTRAHFLWEKSMHGSNTWWNVKDQEWGSGSPVHHDDFWGLWPLLSYYAVWHPHGRITIVFLGLLW